MTEESAPFMTPAELVEKVNRDVAFEAAEKFAAQHVDILTEVREKFPRGRSGIALEESYVVAGNQFQPEAGGGTFAREVAACHS